MGWSIQCNDSNCKGYTWATNIVDLIDNHTDVNGWFVCEHCGGSGFIEKPFDLQEPGHTWKPYLRGAIRLGVPNDTYQPFVFMVSCEPNGKADDIWFSYYKDLRESGGRLKLGYGPGGPPVLGTEQLLALLQRLIDLSLVEKERITKMMV